MVFSKENDLQMVANLKHPTPPKKMLASVQSSGWIVSLIYTSYIYIYIYRE